MSETHEDFRSEISMLHEGRPTLTASELDRGKGRILDRRARPRRGAWQQFARTRGAVVAALAAGLLMSTGGTALGLSGLGLNNTASVAQYAGAGAGNDAGTGTGSGGGQGAGTTSPSQAVSPTEQAAQPAVSTSGQLPYTGFLAIPMLIIGLALVCAGLAGRRAARRSTSFPRS